MPRIEQTYRKFMPQFLHMITLPIFYFIFMLVYRPNGVYEFFGSEWFAVHLTITSSIILLAVIIMRLLYYFIPMSLNYTLYIFWCLGEIIFTSFFVALYLWLVLHRQMPYLEVMSISFKYLVLTLVFPYTVLALSIRLYAYHEKELNPGDNQIQRLRFYDVKHNLKIVLTADSIKYIAADENYVNISYEENGKESIYALRNS